MDIKRIVCLANSRKLSGRCIAGRELISGRRPGAWIRPVSDRENMEVSEYERQYEDGSDPRLLDIIDVPLMEHLPQDHQTENWLLNPDYYWEKAGAFSSLNLTELTDPAAPLWIDGDSTYNGQNDRVSCSVEHSPDSSLRLIHVDYLQLAVFKPGEVFGNQKRRVQARFSHAGVRYGLWVTDPIYERRYLAKLDGDYRIGESFLTVSLGEPYKEYYYKLVAAIIETK